MPTMSLRRSRLGAIAPALFACAVLAPSTGALAEEPPSLVGSWVIDLEASDDLRNEIAERLDERRDLSDGFKNRTEAEARLGVVPVQESGSVLTTSDEEVGQWELRAEARRLRREEKWFNASAGDLGVGPLLPILRHVVTGMAELRVLHSSTELSYRTADGYFERFSLDGKWVETEVSGGTQGGRGQRKKNRILTTLRMSDGSTITSIWKLLPSDQLQLSTTVARSTAGTPTRPLKFVTVYNRKESGRSGRS